LKLLVTGVNGFVARHLIDIIRDRCSLWKIIGTGLSPRPRHINIDSYYSGDLRDKEFVFKLIHESQPDAVIHLASFSSVAQSWQQPIESFQNNTVIYLNLLEAIRNKKPITRVLSIGSSEEYASTSEGKCFLFENDPLLPLSPYAVARVAQEQLSKIYTIGYDLDIVLTRSFNHLGPGQDERFFIPSVIKQLILAKREKNFTPVLKVGDVSVVRDFLDVRDVVWAYILLLEKGTKGEVYNVCSGNGVRLDFVINTISKILDLNPIISVDPSKLRPNENKYIVGSFEKIHKAVGWKPKISLNESLADTIKEMSQDYYG